MATHDYWSAVEDKSLRRNEVTCAWFLALAAVVVLQIITSLTATPYCPAGNKVAATQARVQPSSAREGTRVFAAADQQPCRRR